MENKLQELTRKLYEEGLSKGKSEAETLLENARAEADKILRDANAEAERVKKKAASDSQDLHKNTVTELSLAAKQMISGLKGDIENMVVAKTVEGSVSQIAVDPEFIKEMLITVAKNWKGSSSESIELKAILPESMDARAKEEIAKSATAALGQEIEVVDSRGIKNGFRIGPKNGGYYISFTDSSFNALLGEYLRPKVTEILYGAEE